jgi:site-specific DNA-methyltransferase (adenine-specific)|tara:strand:+ start:78 stop:695 length:618 start_codon:yes stop_codon:yes gene_type:complete
MKITNEDNMELMSRYEDNYFDLAIVDPPYGLGSRLVEGGGKDIMKKYKEEYRLKQWDEEIPSAKYFKELFRVSKNQIIWGGNYFIDHLYNTRGIICWDKKQMMPTMSRWEMAWSSFDKVAKTYEVRSQEKNRFHPTQKPVKLYEWLLMNYAKEKDKILDTHLGSGSIAIACYNLGYNLTACELDKQYYESAMKRIKQHQQQLTIF